MVWGTRVNQAQCIGVKHFVLQQIVGFSACARKLMDFAWCCRQGGVKKSKDFCVPPLCWVECLPKTTLGIFVVWGTKVSQEQCIRLRIFVLQQLVGFSVCARVPGDFMWF